MNLFRKIENLDKDKYIIADYNIKSKTTLRDARS